MDAINEKIQNLLKDVEQSIVDKDYTTALKYLDAILILDPNHEEALYILEKVKAAQSAAESKTSPNVFIEDRIWGLAVTTYYYIDGVQIAKIRDNGRLEFNYELDYGEHELTIDPSPFNLRAKTIPFSIDRKHPNLRIRCYYTKLGFSFEADVHVSDR